MLRLEVRRNNKREREGQTERESERERERVRRGVEGVGDEQSRISKVSMGRGRYFS
jgi:hypothetical protein